LSSLTDFNGHTTAYTCNNMNQLLSKPPDPSFHESAVPCTYWPQGRYRMTDARALTRYNFDNSHRSSGVSERAVSLSCRHDLVGNLTQISGSASTGNYTYDALNRLSTLKEVSVRTKCG
jgi:hypothetical protein